jgi:glycosyltransferase involved in cell wall biosynthesis
MHLQDRVRFIGYLKDSSTAYTDSDLLVYPSRHEIFGMVPFEALYCGTLVIVSGDSGCRKIVREVNCGLS